MIKLTVLVLLISVPFASIGCKEMEPPESSVRGPSIQNVATGQVSSSQNSAAPDSYFINTLADGIHIGGIATSKSGEVYVTDSAFNRIYRYVGQGNRSLVAGSGPSGLAHGDRAERFFSGDGGPATEAQVDSPTGIVIDATGTIYFSDSINQRIRRISPSGTISTFAGTGEEGFAGDNGPALQARFSHPMGIAVDELGDLYVADRQNNRIRKITQSGTITTIAGNGKKGYGGDGGPATAASLNYPHGVFVDNAGIVYIADTFNSRVRTVDRAGVIRTIAGVGEEGFSGEGGPATKAALGVPDTLVVDESGNIFVADRPNGVRKISSEGIIRRIAGNGAFSELRPTNEHLGDGRVATMVPLFTSVVARSSDGRLYIDDRQRLRTLTPTQNPPGSPEIR